MRVLVVGVFRTDVPSLWESIHLECCRSHDHSVIQSWRPPAGAKFTTINQTLTQSLLTWADMLIVTDDDIELPFSFLDRYLDIVTRADLALAQPARALGSTADHVLTLQYPGVAWRETRFVEIGPLFSIRRDLFDTLLPFDEESPMGWGYDYVWPRQVAERGLRMGIVDLVPVMHRFRPGHSYDQHEEHQRMQKYLAKHGMGPQ